MIIFTLLLIYPKIPKMTFFLDGGSILIERSLTYSFTIFAYVASHARRTRWRPVNSAVRNVLPAYVLLLSHYQVGPTCQLHLLPLALARRPAPPLPPRPPGART